MSKVIKEEIMNNLNKSNNKLAIRLKSIGISKLNLICLGNSISSGYSLSSYTKPLILRNENIKQIMKDNSIELNQYTFARTQDNNDEHVFDWIVNDTTLSDLSRYNKFDMVYMNSKGISLENIEEYYQNNNITIKSLLMDSNSNNIVIYNGATGSYLDNITRDGMHFFTYAIKRDCVSIEAILKYIQGINRNNNSNIQVYLCGVPHLLGLSDIFINSRLKKMVLKYANTIYVPNIPKNLIYKKDESGYTLDLHYNENEYLLLNKKIIDEITQNYIQNEIMIELDTILYRVNNDYQKGLINKSVIDLLIDKLFQEVIDKYIDAIKFFRIDLNILLKKIKHYYLSRRPYDFYYIKKDVIDKNQKRLIK